jgi:hypothetical protein
MTRRAFLAAAALVPLAARWRHWWRRHAYTAAYPAVYGGTPPAA